MKHLYRLTVERGDWSFSIVANSLPEKEKGEQVDLPVDGLTGVLHNPARMADIVPAIGFESDDTLLQQIQLRENTEYDFSVTMPLSPDQLDTRRSDNSVAPYASLRLKHVISFNGEDATTVLTDGRYRITGRLNFREQVGVSHLDLDTGDGLIEIPIEVVTRKLNYREEFRALVEGVADIYAVMVLRLDSATETALSMSESVDSSPLIELLHFRRLFGEARLPQAATTICHAPAYKNLPHRTVEMASLCTNPDWIHLGMNVMDFDFVKGGPLANCFCGHTPRTLPNLDITTTLDTDETRYAKHLLKHVLSRLESLRRRLPRKYESSHKALGDWLQTLGRILEHPLWREVGDCVRVPNSMVMMQRHGYRDLLENVMACDLGILIESHVGLIEFSGELKPVYDLYEMWCFFTVYTLLTEITDSDGSPSLSCVISANGFETSLTNSKDRPIRFNYECAEGTPVQLDLFYNREFHSVRSGDAGWMESYSGKFTPDISIRVKIAEATHWIHFDAKYKLNLKQFMAQMEAMKECDATQNDLLSYKRIDLHKMHTYRDALLGTRGSYILYPGLGDTPEVFVRHGDPDYRKNLPMPCVGVYPLRPGTGETPQKQTLLLRNHIESIVKCLASHSEYQEEEGLLA